MTESWRGTAVVTGASSGIGAATAAALAANGWRVVCAARRVERLQTLCDSIGAAAVPIELDVTKAESAATVPERLPENFRDVQVLINCAGHDVGGRRRFDRGAIEDWAGTIETNIVGTMRVTHALLPLLVERGDGLVINIGSITSRETYPGAAAYVASKCAVQGFSAALCADFKGKGVRVSEIVPGLVKTEFAETRWRGDTARAKEFYKQFTQVLEPEDVARAVVYVATQPAHVTISELVVVTSA